MVVRLDVQLCRAAEIEPNKCWTVNVHWFQKESAPS